MHRNPNIVVRTVKPANFLVDITRCYNNSDETLVEVDDMGLAVWRCIEGEMDRGGIVRAFLALLTDEKTEDFVAMVSRDVNEFLDLLVRQGCLVEDA